MELSEIEKRRQSDDQELDGYFDFVDVCNIGKYRIVHRESRKMLGIVDEKDNILIPLIYDDLELKYGYIESKIKIGNTEFIGCISIDEPQVILPARYCFINLLPDQNMISCYDSKQWKLVSLDNRRLKNLSRSLLPFDSAKFICLLRKCREDSFNIECWDENDNHSQSLLRMLAKESDCPNRIKLTNKYFNLVVFTDIYGQVLFANRDLNDVFI